MFVQRICTRAHVCTRAEILRGARATAHAAYDSYRVTNNVVRFKLIQPFVKRARNNKVCVHIDATMVVDRRGADHVGCSSSVREPKEFFWHVWNVAASFIIFFEEKFKRLVKRVAWEGWEKVGGGEEATIV